MPTAAPPVDAATRTAIVLAVQQQIAVDATAEVPTEERLKTFYEKNRARYESPGEMTLRDLVAPAGAAEAAAAALKAGTPVAAVMARHGLKDSGKIADGTELYFAAEIHLGAPLYKAAVALKDGEVAGPLPIGGEQHILVLARNEAPVPEPYAEARDAVYNDYKTDLETRLRDGEYRFLRGRSDIRIAPQNR